MKSIEIGDNIESDHHPLIVRLKETREGELRKKERSDMNKVDRGIWDEVEREWFKNWIEKLEIKEGDVDEELKVMGDKLSGALEKMGRGRETKRGGENTDSRMGNAGRARRRLGKN